MHTLSPKCIYYHCLRREISPNCIYYPRIEVQTSPDCIYYPRFEESTKYFQTAAPRIAAGKVFKH